MILKNYSLSDLMCEHTVLEIKRSDRIYNM